MAEARIELARALWAYGEDELWPQARQLSEVVIAEIADMAEELLKIEPSKALSRKMTRAKALVVSAIHVVEGKQRPPARRRRRDGKHLPGQLLTARFDPDPDK